MTISFWREEKLTASSKKKKKKHLQLFKKNTTKRRPVSVTSIYFKINYVLIVVIIRFRYFIWTILMTIKNVLFAVVAGASGVSGITSRTFLADDCGKTTGFFTRRGFKRGRSTQSTQVTLRTPQSTGRKGKARLIQIDLIVFNEE